MPRPKQQSCPIAGCKKRGRPADLARHATAKHPDVDRGTYLQLLLSSGTRLETGPGGVLPMRFPVAGTEPATLGWMLWWIATRGTALAVALMAFAYLVHYVASAPGIK